MRTGIEPVISSVTGRHVNRYTNAPAGADEGNRTLVSTLARSRSTIELHLQMASSSRFERLTVRLEGGCSIHWATKTNGAEAGIWTQAPVSRPTGFQDRTLQPLGYFCRLRISCKDNPGLISLGISSVHKTQQHPNKSIQVVVPARIELATQGFSVLCSTDWATEPDGCEEWIWTNDLQVMSLASYRAALPRDVMVIP